MKKCNSCGCQITPDDEQAITDVLVGLTTATLSRVTKNFQDMIAEVAVESQQEAGESILCLECLHRLGRIKKFVKDMETWAKTILEPELIGVQVYEITRGRDCGD